MRFAFSLAIVALSLLVALPAWAQSSQGQSGQSAPTSSAVRSVVGSVQVQQVSVPGSGVRAGRVTTVVEAPLDTVAAVVTDFASYHEFLPQLTISRVVRRRRGHVDVYLQASLLDNLGTLWSVVRFRVHRSPDALIVDGSGVQGNLARFEVRIEATCTAEPGRTQVTLQLLGIPALPFPPWLLDAQQTRWAIRGVQALRQRAEWAVASTPRAGAPGASPVQTGGGPAVR